jgi:histidinol dehydrogenase
LSVADWSAAVAAGCYVAGLSVADWSAAVAAAVAAVVAGAAAVVAVAAAAEAGKGEDWTSCLWTAPAKVADKQKVELGKVKFWPKD